VLHDDGGTIVSEDTFSEMSEGVCIYGDKSKNSWGGSWSGKIVTSKVFKVGVANKNNQSVNQLVRVSQNLRFFLFQRAVIILIVLNSISIALSTFDFVRDREDLRFMFNGLDAIFLIIFTVEVFLKFLYAGPKFFVDGWLVFDLLVVSSAWFLHPLSALRTFRLVRTLRLATRVRDLHYLVTALLSVVPKVLCICFLMCILFFTFSIIFTDLFKDLYRDGHTSVDYFSRMDTTAWTLFQIMTLDNWGAITYEVMQVYSWAWLPFLLFILSSSFFFLNLIIGKWYCLWDSYSAFHQNTTHSRL
jgi:voltage-gated sodium channel